MASQIYKFVFSLVSLSTCIFGTGCSSSPRAEDKHTSYKGLPCPLIEADDIWITVKHNPRWGDALIASMFGEKNLSPYITGGLPIESTKRDVEGKIYFVTKNQNDEIMKVVDGKTGCPIGRRQTARNQVNLSD